MTECKPLRAKQRAILFCLIDNCGSRAWTRIRQFSASDAHRSLYTGDTDVPAVYLRMSPRNLEFRYVGETVRPAQRDNEHLVGASYVMSDSQHPRAEDVLHSDVVAARYGGGGMFTDIPLHVFLPGTPKHTMRRCELQLIRALGTTNRKGDKHWHVFNVLSRGAKRGRPPKRIRELTLAPERETNVPLVTLYRVHEQRSADLRDILCYLQTAPLPATIRVTLGRFNLTNRTTCKRMFGKTQVAVSTALGHDTVRTLTADTWVASMHSRCRIRVETVQCTDPVAARGGISALAVHIGAHPAAAHALRRILQFAQLEALWLASDKLAPRRLRDSCRVSLNAMSHWQVGFNLTYRPLIRFPASAPVLTATVRRAARIMLRAIPNPAAAARLRRRLRVVRTRATTVGQVLHNGPVLCREFDRLTCPKCTCEHFPAEWCEPSETSLPIDGHFCILGSAYTGPRRAVFRVSHKTPILVGQDDLPRVVRSALSEMWAGLPDHITVTACDTIVACVTSTAAAACAPDTQLIPGPGAVTLSDVRRVRKYLQHAVVSAVDKGPGQTALMCPVVFHSLILKTWPSEPERCQVLQCSEWDVMMHDIREYERRGWSRLARLFGCDAEGYPTDRAEVPWAFVLIKLKSFVQRVLKGRPIGPHMRIPLRWLYNLIATAHAWMLMHIRTMRAGRMYTTAEYPQRLRAEHAALEARMGPGLRVHSLFGDLENMYVELGHATIEDAFTRNAARYRASATTDTRYALRTPDAICVPRSGATMASCRAGRATDEDHVTVLISDIADINAYSNSRSIMHVGTEMRRYFKGTPMGEQSSCAKANGVGLDAELTFDEQRQASHGDAARNMSLAYVDDAHVRIAYYEDGRAGWSEESARDYARGLMGCYPSPLRMVAEPEGLPSYRFLETTTFAGDDFPTWCIHYNRPWRQHSYNVQAPCGPLFMRQQRAVETANAMRSYANTSQCVRPLLAFALAARCHELYHGVGHTASFVRAVLQRFGRDRRFAEFFACFGPAIWTMSGI